MTCDWHAELSYTGSCRSLTTGDTYIVVNTVVN